VFGDTRIPVTYELRLRFRAPSFEKQSAPKIFDHLADSPKNELALLPRRGSLIPRGHSLMVKFQPSKLAMRVRFPLPAICLFIGKLRLSERFYLQSG
jgi:hypothetical protein